MNTSPVHGRPRSAIDCAPLAAPGTISVVRRSLTFSARGRRAADATRSRMQGRRTTFAAFLIAWCGRKKLKFSLSVAAAAAASARPRRAGARRPRAPPARARTPCIAPSLLRLSWHAPPPDDPAAQGCHRAGRPRHTPATKNGRCIARPLFFLRSGKCVVVFLGAARKSARDGRRPRRQEPVPPRRTFAPA
jgi:hypothetical protein